MTGAARTIGHSIRLRVRTLAVGALTGCSLVATAFVFRTYPEFPALTLFFVGGALTVGSIIGAWSVRCPRCSGLLGGLAVETTFPSLQNPREKTPNYCPLCGVGFGEPLR
jgi:hypothetical protein